MKNPQEKQEHAKESRKKDNDMNLVIIIGVIVVIFAAFIIGFRLLSKERVRTIDQLHQDNIQGKLGKDEGYVYNGYSFVYAQGMWFTQIQKFRTTDLYNVQFHYGPKDLENIPIAGNVSDFTNFNSTYVSFDPTGKEFTYIALASAELSLDLALVFKIVPIAACSKNETSVCWDRPIINCSNARNPVIFIERADKPLVIRENEACIRIMGNGTDIIKATDKLLLSWFGIMK